MRKIAITTLVLLLTFGTIAPYEISANSLDNSKRQLEDTGKEDNDFIEDDVNDVENNEGSIDETVDGEEAANKEEEADLELPSNKGGPTSNDNDPNGTSQEDEIENVSKEEVEQADEESIESIKEDNDDLIELEKENDLNKMSRSLSVVIEESGTSKLGQIKNTDAFIYDDLNNMSSVTKVDSSFIDQVYFIKKQAEINNELFYLLSDQPSSTSGTIGWVNANDLTTHSHESVDRKSKTFYFKGTANTYNRVWGGVKNRVHHNIDLKGQELKVNLTEKVGSRHLWYRGKVNGKTVWVHHSHLVEKKESKTSKLGQIKSKDSLIYTTLGDNSSSKKAGTSHIDYVYFIKKQAEINDELFYLLSDEPSSTSGTIGWVNARDLTTHSHESVDRKSKTFYFKGTANTYNRVWGGVKNRVHHNINLKGQELKVNLTEKVGSRHLWYRGKVNGKTVWVHHSHLVEKKESKTSKLGQIKSKDSLIYTTLGDNSSSKKAGTSHIDYVYFIKKQAEINDELFYLLSDQPSSTSGTIGWVNARDLTTHSHESVDRKSKTFYFKGTANTYNRVWGGVKNRVHHNIDLKGQELKVNLTEKVGNRHLWYRGKVNGETVWVHESHLTDFNESKYNITLKQALDIQMKVAPQTDTKYAWVSKEYIDRNNKVTASLLNVRPAPNTHKSNKPLGTLSKGKTVKILDEYNGWYAIDYNHNTQWVHASPKDVLYYLNPENFINDNRQQFQFLDLSKNSGASASVLNNYLKGKGTLAGQGQAFIEAGRKHGVNDVYLISHAILETGNGSSTLASGVPVDKNGNVTRNKNGKITETSSTVTKVYNMYGIGAFDNCPLECGAKRAYEEKWTSPKKAIIGGAEFIGNDYIKAGQNTLYKMRWNPGHMDNKGTASHQYATDVGWASKQIYNMYNLYQEIGSYTLHLDIPIYR